MVAIFPSWARGAGIAVVARVVAPGISSGDIGTVTVVEATGIAVAR